jgi:hypothetical protein
MDNQGREYRYQRDWSMGGQMFHVRCDDWEQFLDSCTHMESMLPSNEAFPNDTGKTVVTPQQAVNAPVCGVHHIPMVLKPAGISKMGKAYPAFYSCPQRNQDGSYCTFKPEK